MHTSLRINPSVSTRQDPHLSCNIPSNCWCQRRPWGRTGCPCIRSGWRGHGWGSLGRRLDAKRRAQCLTSLLPLATKSLLFFLWAGVRTVELKRELRGTEQRGEFLKEITIKDLFLVRSVTIMYKDHFSISFK